MFGLGRNRPPIAAPPRSPPPLDQVSAQQLIRLAAERPAASAVAPATTAARKARRGASFFSRNRSVLVKLAFLPMSGFLLTGLVVGVTDVASEGSFGAGDALRLGLMALAAASFGGQLFGLRRLLPGAAHAAVEPPPTPPLLLDQVSAQALSRLAPPRLGRTRAGALLQARGRRALDAASWLALVASVLIIAVALTAGRAAGMLPVLSGEAEFGVSLFLQVGFIFLAAGGAVLLGLTGIRGLRDRRRRRRGRLLKRLLRYLLHLFDRGKSALQRAGGVLAGEGSAAARLGLGAVLTATVLAAAFVPLQAGDTAQGRDGSGSSTSGSGAPSGGATPSGAGGLSGGSTPAGGGLSATPTVAAATATPGSVVAPASPASAPAQPSPTSQPAPPSPAATASSPPTQTPSLTPTPTPAPTRTPTPTRTATPCSACPPTPTPTPLGFSF